jgi:hypothetical protein
LEKEAVYKQLNIFCLRAWIGTLKWFKVFKIDLLKNKKDYEI